MLLQPACLVVNAAAIDRVVLEFNTEKKTGGTDKPQQTEPAATEPSVTQPPVTEPVETAPAATEPVVTEPPGTEPAVTEPPATEPEEEKGGTEPVQYVTNFPLYFQNDYKDIRYGSGTVATSGCGIVALAMVATYMTGHDYYPDELAEYFGSYNAVSNAERMLHAADELQLPWHLAKDWRESLAALKEGCPVIVLEDSNSKFTEGQHFLVLTGVTEDGRILVYDSNRNNYNRWELKKGFEIGFTEAEICAGYCGSWIFDIHEMPEDPFIYEPEERLHVKPRYPSVELTDAETELLARLVWAEARGEPDKGQQAVAEIVLNRLVSGNFGGSVESIIYGEGQFRSVPKLEDAEPTSTQYEAIENAVNGPYVLPLDVYYFATEALNDNVWGQIGGHIFCY